MPSRAYQGVWIIKKKNPKTGRYILISKRTGFKDVWIGDTHYYYNYTATGQNFDNLDIAKIVQDYQDRQNGKKVIVVRRK